MASKKTVIISLISIFVVFICALIIMQFTGRIPKNPAGTVGNYGGNLNNGGYFCQDGDRVYFANFYDGGTLYSMKPDQTDMKKLSNAEIQYINAGGNYLYYYQKNSSAASSLGFVVHVSGLYRCRTNGKNVICLDKSDCSVVNLVDNTVFYEKAIPHANTLQLCQISTNKTNYDIAVPFLLNPATADNGTIYYNASENNHYLSAYDTTTGNSNVLYEYDVWNPVLSNGNIYFMDIHNNYRLCSYSLADGSAKVLTQDRVDAFNVYGNYVYYQKVDETAPALIRMNLDGSNPEILAEGTYCDINVTSDYVYFRAFKTEMPVYMVSTNGGAVTTFDAASKAALANMK